MYNNTAVRFAQNRWIPSSNSFIYMLLLAFSVVWIARRIQAKPQVLSKTTPTLWKKYEWPILGSSLHFYGKRSDMVTEGAQKSPNGTFSFHIGSKHVVSLGGVEGRKIFFDNKDFSVSQGYAHSATS